MRAGAVALCLAAGALPTHGYEVMGDGIPAPLTQQAGDVQRGRSIVAQRQQGLCLLCHSAPIPEERFQGNLAPPLDGAGTRWNAAQLRLRIADPRRLNPGSLMPAFHAVPDAATSRAQRVGAAWQGQPILSAQQVEDVVAYLQTLK